MNYNFYINAFENLDHAKDKMAVVGTDKALTWQQVYDSCEKLKSLLNVLPNDKPVIIYGEKEANFPVAMLTLINLNTIYVPVDAIMPAERVKKIADILGAKVMINCSSKPTPIEIEFVIDANFNLEKGSKSSVENKKAEVKDPVRYILFTSGSTGEPKGVQITGAALNDFTKWYSTWPGITKDSVYMNQAPFSFDISLCDFIGTFHHGATMVLNNYEILKDANKFLQRLSKYQANVMVCTPSFIYMYVSTPQFNEQNYPALKNYIFIGEELPVATVKKLKRVFPGSRIVNSYGPTEATVVVTYLDVTDEIVAQHPTSLPIGFMKPGSEMLVLNDSNNPEETGELVIVGDNVSVGYLNNKEKNEAAFYLHNGKRAYKTGDQGYIKNGMIYFLGRNDNQVKLNGYRIELDEISEVLQKQDHIANAVTVPLKQGSVVKKIVSFVTLKQGDLNVEDTKLKISKHLPSYMIPSEIIAVKEFPVNSNYKTDKKALIEYYINL